MENGEKNVNIQNNFQVVFNFLKFLIMIVNTIFFLLSRQYPLLFP